MWKLSKERRKDEVKTPQLERRSRSKEKAWQMTDAGIMLPEASDTNQGLGKQQHWRIHEGITVLEKRLSLLGSACKDPPESPPVNGKVVFTARINLSWLESLPQFSNSHA